MLIKKKVLIASGSRHTIPPISNSPGVARIIYQLTENDTDEFQYVVLSKQDENLKNNVFNSDKFLYPKTTFATRLFQWFLIRTPYRFRKRIFGISQPDRIIYYRSLIRRAKKVNPDIVVTFMHIELFKMLQGKIPTAKHIFFYRSTDIKGRIGEDNIEFIFKKSAGFLANTQSPLIELKSLKDIKFPMATIYNAVPKVNLTFEEQKRIGLIFRQKFGLNKQNFVLGYAGRFSEEKSLLELLQVIKSFKDEGVIMHLIIAGDIENEKTPDFSYYNKLMSFIDSNINEQVHMAGWLPNSELNHFYSALDIGVLLSKYREGNSMFLIEAMSFGIPIIATAVGGNIEIIKNMVNGILIDKNQISTELKNAIQFLNHNIEDYKIISKNAKKYTRNKHSINTMKEIFEEFLKRV